ncbi:MAG TPA: RluA family pseudouridine synthase [Candidatus Nanopelagicaceae bacterium]|nr:RluA family pseudouridine synthase [Candidatus Nanopelagicaceae bacterium]
MSEIRTLEIPEGVNGERVDRGISRLFGFSRNQSAEIAESGGVRLNGAVVGKSDRMVSGATLEVRLPEPPAPVVIRPEIIDGMRIIFDDEDIVVVDKPVGVAAHPSMGWTGPTVLGGLAGAGYRISTSGAAERAGIVQRLDVGTSGLMVVAKSEGAYTALKNAFRERQVEKIYNALVQGHPDPSTGTIDAPIDRHPRDDWKFAVVEGGKPSITHYETIESFAAATLLKIELETGRTHQIRVHMAAMKHPCVGDIAYGADPVLAKSLEMSRQWLHAVELSFIHPRTGVKVHFTSDYPHDLANALARLSENR